MIKVIKVLVICTANRGRSPLAEAILRRKLLDRGLAQVQVESAGLCTYELGRTGMTVDPRIADMAARRGLDLSQHHARPLDASGFGEFDLIIVMEEWQAEVLHRVFHPRGDKVFILRQLGGESGDPNTPDTAGVPQDALEAYFEEAERCLEKGLNGGPLARLLESLGDSGARSLAQKTA